MWDNPAVATGLSRKLSGLKDKVELSDRLHGKREDVSTLFELHAEEADDDLLGEIDAEITALQTETDRAEIKTFLTGQYDDANAIVSIHPGAGGTESCDWAAMLSRMYLRWAETEGLQIKELDSMPGEVAGIKSVTYSVSGNFAYGYLRGECGVHRLVRISPFDSSARRHTSFASVDVFPEVENDTEIEVKPEEVRVDVFRSSGAGGQSVNTTDSAVRITHLETNIVVTCQNERSQITNRQTAMRILKARLLEKKIKEQEAAMAKIKGEQSDIAWGHQIRSYVLQPYTKVKDHRTEHETSAVTKVLDGDLVEFIRSYLTWSSSQS